MAKFSLPDIKVRFNTLVFTNLRQLITGKLLNGILHDIVDSVTDWLNSYVLKSDSRKGVVQVVEGDNDIPFGSSFPEGTQLCFAGTPLCYDNEGFVGYTIISITISGIKINCVAPATFHYKIEKL